MKRLIFILFLMPLILISQDLEFKDGKRYFESGTVMLPEFSRIGAYIPEDSTQTTAVGVDTWTFLGAGDNNKFVNIYTTDKFSFTGDTLQYIGTDSIYLHIEYGGALSCNTNSETVHFTILIDDVEQEQFTAATYCKTADELYAIAGLSNIVYIGPNDTIKIMVKSNSATTVTTQHFSISAYRIF